MAKAVFVWPLKCLKAIYLPFEKGIYAVDHLIKTFDIILW